MELTDKCRDFDCREFISKLSAEMLKDRFNLNAEDYYWCNHPRGIECIHYNDCLRLSRTGLCRKKD